jgi:protease-4
MRCLFLVVAGAFDSLARAVLAAAACLPPQGRFCRHADRRDARVVVVGALALALVVSVGVRAQGVPESRSGAALVNMQAAAVDDGVALLVNPAGLAAVEGLELGGGWFVRGGRNGTSVVSQVVDAYLATSSPFGVVAGGLGTVEIDGALPRLRASFGTAWALDTSLAVGTAVHAVEAVTPGDFDVLVDVGVQARLARFLAFGLVGEGLATKSSSLRAGLSLRPLDELLTIGIDARVVPGSSSDAATALTTATWTPGVNARLQWGGLGVFGGVGVTNLQAVATGPIVVEGLVGLQGDLDHVGLAAFGGAGDGPAGGLRARMSTAAWPSLLPAGGRWLHLELAPDGAQATKRRTILDTLFGESPSAGAVLAALDAAADDASVEGVVLQLPGLALGWGRAGELRAAITRLRGQGKKVVVHLDAGDDVDAFVASAADKVWLSPSGSLAVDGVRAEMVYVGEALRRLGFAAEAVAAGRYKSAPRAFTHDGPSAEELEVENALLDGVYDALVAALAEGRGLAPDAVRATIDLGGLAATEAVERRFVDAVVYVDEIPARVAALAGREGQRVFLEKGWLDAVKKTPRWDAPPRIALIPVQGTIQRGRSRSGLFDGDSAGSDDIVDAVREAAEDDDVKAIVLRVDSPGGDALASDLMWRAVMLAREKKPVIASMGDVAASGGYYVASAAHDIFVEPNTITGSIGVFGLLFNAERFAADHGIRAYEVQRGARPGPTLFRPTTEAERARLQSSVDATYERFLDAVVAGRGAERLARDDLRNLAEGRVWTGAQALERKLVDATGSVVDAIKLARERAGIDPDDVVAVAVITGSDGDLPGLGGVRAVARASAAAFGLDERAALSRAVKLLVGDPEAVALAVDSEGRPLALGPGFVIR